LGTLAGGKCGRACLFELFAVNFRNPKWKKIRL
jgi:hypothetical protein